VILGFIFPLRGIDLAPLLLLRRTSAVFRAALLAVFNASAVQCPADNMIADAGQIFDAAAADQYYRVFLEVVSRARNICRNLYAVSQTYTCNLAKSRVRLLGSYRINAGTDASALRVFLKRGRRGTRSLVMPSMPYKLCDAWQIASSFSLHFQIFSTSAKPPCKKSHIYCSAERQAVRGAKRR
jgi:hypothetical protein